MLIQASALRAALLVVDDNGAPFLSGERKGYTECEQPGGRLSSSPSKPRARFTRREAVDVLRARVGKCELPG